MEKRARVTERILDAVIACKHEAVGEAVSLSQISCKAGISERTLNRYFPDKELLIYHAAVKFLRGRYQALAQQYEDTDKSGMNALERLLLLINMQMENYRTDLDGALMFVRAYSTCLNTAVYHKLPIAGFDASIRSIITACVEEGVRDGSMRGDVVPVDTYLLISSNFNGLVQRLIYMSSIQYTEDEHREEILLVFAKYLKMLRGWLGA